MLHSFRATLALALMVAMMAASSAVAAGTVSLRTAKSTYVPVSLRNPTACDDGTKGYAVGQIWNNTSTSRLFRLANADTCAAIWEELPPVSTLVGDAVSTSNLKGLWGINRLKDSYTGPLADIFRTSDNTSTTVSFVSATNGIDQSKVSGFSQGSTVRFGKFYDQSGNSNEASNTTVGSMPIYSTETGRPGVLFNRIQNVGTAIASTTAVSVGPTLTASNTAATFCWVGTINNIASNQGIWQAGTPTYLFDERTSSLYGRTLNPSLGTNRYAEMQRNASVNCMALGGSSTISIANDASLTVASAYSPTAFSGLRFGATGTGSNVIAQALSAEDIQGFWFYDTGLTDDQLNQVRLAAYRQFGIAPQASTYLHAFGDSITAGQNAVSNTTYPSEVGKMANDISVYNWGAPGETLANWLGSAGVSSSMPQISGQFRPNSNNIVTFLLGTNDIGLGTTNSATVMYNSVTLVVNNLRASATTVQAPLKIAVGTVLPRAIGAGSLTIINQFNTLIRANAAGADAIVEYASDTILSQCGASTTVCSDALHPTAYGQRRMGAVLFNSIKQWLP